MARKKKIKRERGLKWEPKVRRREDRGKWMVDLGTKFSPRKLYFDTEEDAKAAAREKLNEYRGRLAGQRKAAKEKVAFNWFNLSPTQQHHLEEVYALSNGETEKIGRAYRFYIKHAAQADSSRLLADVYAEYIAAKKGSGKRPRTIEDAEFKLKPFVATFGSSNISEISTTDIESWLNKKGCVATTRNAYRVAISGLFNHAVKRCYTEHNPARAVERVVRDQGLPDIHSVSQVEAMLRAASNFVPVHKVVTKRDKNRKILKIEERQVTDSLKIFEARSVVVPYLAIGYFAGLRPENELANLDWKNIDFNDKSIRVDPATAKKRRQRFVDMSDNLRQWLAPYRRQTGKIGFSRKYFRAIRERAKVKWSNDVMRHSFGSYLLAYNEDPKKTALQMGHTGVDVLFNHYRNLVKKSDAAQYWSIVPEQDVDVIPLPISQAQ